MLKANVKTYLDSLEAQTLIRKKSVIPRNMLSFSSNDYLGLTQNQTVQEAYQAGFKKYRTGSTGSMLVSGYHEAHEALEHAFTKALRVDDALLFPSGYAANLSIMQLLSKLKIHALIDKALHASFYDGLKLSGGQYTRYINTPKAHYQNAMIITESIFSMRGNMPNLNELSKNYPLIVDEAHAFGVIGHEGLGAAYAIHASHIPLRIIPFGKALGSSGAIVAGDKDWIKALLQAARPMIYSTAMSPALAHGILHALQILREANTERKKLMENIQYFKTAIKHSPLTWQDSNTPIQQLKLGCPKKAIAYAAYLKQHNIHCVAMREPTVKRIDTGLRIVLTSAHTSYHIQQLFACLHQCPV